MLWLGVLMANPPKPAELKMLQGNPGKRAMPSNDGIAPMEYGYVEPPSDLRESGLELWNKIFGAGELWISIRTDTQLVAQVCRQLDRRDELSRRFWDEPESRVVNMSLLETEKAVVNGLSLLGFTPADRTRLGLVSARTKSKLQELMDAKARGE
jgi:hypothetical protein